ncbi:L,D-transpeptidase [candidate division WWE3 bacterium]|nr:L,D-transpeptidase [candidate division WWE3 bacterium]
MKSKLLILVLSLLLLVVIAANSSLDEFKPVKVFKPNTKIGNLDLGGVEWNQGYSTLISKLNNPIYLYLSDKSRGVTLKEIGFDIDRDKLEKLAQNCRPKKWRIFCQNTSNEVIDPSLALTINNWILGQFLGSIENDIQYLAKNTVVSFEDYTFRAVTPGSKIEVDKNMFLDKNRVINWLTSDDNQIKLHITSSETKDEQKRATEQVINKVGFSLLIKYGRNPIYIPAERIKAFISVVEKDSLTYGKLNDYEINRYLDELDLKYKKEDVLVIRSAAVDAIKRALLFRATNYEINTAVILPLEGKPKTNGEMADVYLEVNKSQQRLYKFEHGKLVKTYIISTGLTWETPPGEFVVLGKEKMAISYQDDWYMPNYLPIGTVYGYRFGFHSIPYHLDAAGNIYSRDSNTMGSPATGGCIQLTQDDSLELFDWAKIGTPVYIYE